MPSDTEARPMPEGSPVVLVVDDEPDVRQFVAAALQRLLPGVRVVTASSAREALALLEAGGATLVLSDYRMGDVDGVELLTEVRKRWPWIGRALLTGFPEEARVVAAAELGTVSRVLGKPLPPAELARAVAALLGVGPPARAP